MNSSFIFSATIILFLFLFNERIRVHGQNEDSILTAELLMADLELQEDCQSLAIAMKTSLIHNSFSGRINALSAHGLLLKTQSDHLKTFENVPYDVFKNWTTLVKSGDTVLSTNDWNFLVSYHVGNEELKHTAKVHCGSKQQNCPTIKTSYENLLLNSRIESILRKSWSAWQTLLSLRREQFPEILNLIQKAALQNEQSNAKEYWEMLVQHEDAYELAEALWMEVEPLYLKLHNFVKQRLFKFYKVENSTEIPVYMLGSNFGYDWSYLADIILPHPQIYHNAKSYLAKKSVQDIYKLSEELTEQLSLGKLGDGFWSNSLFNMTFCENHVLSFCSQEHSELLTCDKTSWVTYLDSSEVAVDVALRNTNYLILSRMNLRYLVIDEAIKSLASVLAIKNMRHNGMLNKHLFSSGVQDPNKMTELLLIALRVLPRLPFYLMADKWRLHLLDNGVNDMEEIWWNFRKQYQGLKGVSNEESDFLGEPYIMSNRPYLSKFFGTILQFQLLQQFQHNMVDLEDNIALHIGNDEQFLNMIQERTTEDWQDVIFNNYQISYLSANSLLDYFNPLETYLESAPLEQIAVTTTTPEQSTTESQSVKVPQLTESQRNQEITPAFSIEEDDDVPKHIHPIIIDRPNPSMEKFTMYIGLGLLVAVGAVLFFVIGSKKMKGRKQNTNRR